VVTDYLCEKPVAIFDSEGRPLKQQAKILPACIIGGGDCTAVAFLFELKELGKGTLISKVRDVSKKFVWIKVDKSIVKEIEGLVPELGTGSNSIEFRPSFKEIYSDKKLSKRIDLTELTKLPKGRKLNSDKESIEFVLTDSFTLNNKKVLEIKINLIELDLKALKDSGELEATDKGKRIELRKIYFPTKDEKGRISYWFVPQSC
jgi:hypothetical protein